MLQIKSYHLFLLPALFLNNTSVIFSSLRPTNQNPPNTYLPQNPPNPPNPLNTYLPQNPLNVPQTNVIHIKNMSTQIPIIAINNNTVNNVVLLWVPNPTVINNYIFVPVAVPTNQIPPNNYAQQVNPFTNQGNPQMVTKNSNNTKTCKYPWYDQISYKKNNG